MSSELKKRVFAQVKRHWRKASIAELHERQNHLPLESTFGGDFWGSPEFAWPEWNDQPLLPLIQVRTSELPFRPAELENIALLQLFVCGGDELPMPSEPNGTGWLVKTYGSLDGLSPIETPDLPMELSIKGLSWRLVDDAPDWEDATTSINPSDLAAFVDLTDSFEAYAEANENHTGIKFGGWPHWIQGSLGVEPGFVFQMDSVEEWMWGDVGMGQFFFRAGNWEMSWDCC